MSDNDDIIEEIKKNHSVAKSKLSTWESNARSDFIFINGDPYNDNQWDFDLLSNRKNNGYSNLSTYTINKAKQHLLMALNSCKQQQQGVKINAVGIGSTDLAAQTLEGIVRHIETKSNAVQNAYNTAMENQFKIGIGWVHIDLDYVDNKSFDKDLFIRTVNNPLNVYWDTDYQEPDMSDMTWAMIVDNYSFDDFESVFKKDPDVYYDTSFDDDSYHHHMYMDEDSRRVKVVTYYKKSMKKDTLWEVPSISDNGSTVNEYVLQSTLDPEKVNEFKKEKFKKRIVENPNIRKIILAGKEIIFDDDTPFESIPLVPFIGEEVRGDDFGSQRDYVGFVRQMIHPQTILNESVSSSVDTLRRQSMVQYLGPRAAFDGHEKHWSNATKMPIAFLPYNSVDDKGNPIQPPTPSQPPQSSSGYSELAQMADLNMQMVTGQYQSEMGAPGNEKSGIAIQQRQRQSDTSSYNYTDNQGRALRRIGKLIVDAIPKIYTTMRAVRSLGLDGSSVDAIVDPNIEQSVSIVASEQMLQKNPNFANLSPEDQLAIEGAILVFNPNYGAYEVEADVGPAFATQRQDAFNALTQIVQQDPALMQKIGDLIFKTADFPLAAEIANRLKPAAQDPQAAAMQQQLQQAQQQIQLLTQQLKDKTEDTQLKRDRLNHDMVVSAMSEDTDRYKAMTQRVASIASEDPTSVQQLIIQTVQQAMQSGLLSQQPFQQAEQFEMSPVQQAQQQAAQQVMQQQAYQQAAMQGNHQMNNQQQIQDQQKGDQNGSVQNTEMHPIKHMPSMNPPGGPINSPDIKG